MLIAAACLLNQFIFILSFSSIFSVDAIQENLSQEYDYGNSAKFLRKRYVKSNRHLNYVPNFHHLWNGSVASLNTYAAANPSDVKIQHSSNERDLPELTIRRIAVFFLGSLVNAQSLGDLDRSYFDEDFFYRAEISRATWAKHAKYFFYVTGNGEPERYILPNESVCKNVSKAFHMMIPDFKQEVYECNNIMILHLPYCNGESWGSNGPCCRCQGAMKFFLDVKDVHESGKDILHHSISHHHKRDEIVKGDKFSFADWFIFSDDDFYIRLNFLESLLMNPATPPSEPFTIIPESPVTATVFGSSKHHRSSFGMGLYNENCTNSCIHRFSWMSFGGFSIGALRQLKSSIENDDLPTICRNWETTHDVALGLLTWMHSLTAIQVLQDSQHLTENVVWHKPWLVDTYDVLFDMLWQQECRSRKTECNPHNDNRPIPFNITAYLLYEHEAGKRLQATWQPFKITGAHSTLLHRREAVQNEVLSQVQNNLIVSELIKHDSYIRIINYKKENCDEDAAFFNNWYRSEWPKLSSKPNHQNSNNQAAICLEYAKYVNNYPIAFEGGSYIPKDEDLE